MRLNLILILLGLIAIAFSLYSSIWAHELVHVDNGLRVGCEANVTIDMKEIRAYTSYYCPHGIGVMSNFEVANSINESVAYNTQYYLAGIMLMLFFILIAAIEYFNRN